MKTKKKENSFIVLCKKKPFGALGLVLLIAFLFIAIFADRLAPYPMINGAMQVDIIHKLKASSPQHWMGTDSLGRDVLSYLIYGARTSVVLCLTCTIISTVISVAIGTMSAVIGGWFDLIVQRLVDGFQCVPTMLILLMLMACLGNGIPQLIFALSVPGGIGGARIIRSAAFSVKDSGYVKSSRLLGSNVFWRTIVHVIPNTLPLIIVNMAGMLGGVIMQEASLNFLGYGVDPGTPSWGYMITNQGRSNMYTAPWLAIYPGLLIMTMVFSANMLGDAVRDLMDPRLKGGVGSYDTKKIRRIAAKMQAKIANRAS
jgi:peptide/nickel transport system permease protein